VHTVADMLQTPVQRSSQKCQNTWSETQSKHLML